LTGDFTPVCTTELGRAAQLKTEFSKRNAKLCGFSCNDAASHRSWIQDIEAATGAYVDFPLFCDPTRIHALSLKILDMSSRDSSNLPNTVRSVYVLKPDKTIALMITYPASTGRNFDEILRALDSLQLTANYSVATPADWTQGEDVIVDFALSNSEAKEKFDSYRVVTVPSEEWKTVDKNYLRYTEDPSSERKRWWRKLLRN
jgi:alkyl hydroperoxide reductase subunit AhpC